MKIGILKEQRSGEQRVAAVPETVKKMVSWGAEVVVESGAGLGSQIEDRHYSEAGASLTKDYREATTKADIVLKVQRPLVKERRDEMAALEKGTLLIGLLAPLEKTDTIPHYAKNGVDAFSMEMIPRISRAQTMDALSSQSNLAGYRAVLEAAARSTKLMPMMMTAAGTVKPAKVLVLGAGVAGLQAIATAKRLGAVVSAFDVRPAVKEQVESLGASFVEVEGGEDAETSGGYAKEMSEDYQKRQAEAIHKAAKASDIIVTTALIPGKPAPKLITNEMLQEMRKGSVVVDLAAPAGGNCTATVADEEITYRGITVLGDTNPVSKVAADASPLYAKNILNLLELLVDKEEGKLHLNMEDEIVKGGLLTKGGQVIHERFKEGLPSTEKKEIKDKKEDDKAKDSDESKAQEKTKEAGHE